MEAHHPAKGCRRRAEGRVACFPAAISRKADQNEADELPLERKEKGWVLKPSPYRDAKHHGGVLFCKSNPKPCCNFFKPVHVTASLRTEGWDCCVVYFGRTGKEGPTLLEMPSKRDKQADPGPSRPFGATRDNSSKAEMTNEVIRFMI